MKKIIKNHLIKTKLIAALMAALMIFMAVTLNTKKASAAVLPFNSDFMVPNISEYHEVAENLAGRITDSDLEKMKKVGIQTLVAALGEFVPGGKTMGPAVSELLGVSFLGKQTSLDDINDNINGLYDRINQFEKDMKEELKNIISLGNFDYSLFTPFNSQIHRINLAIRNAQDNYSVKEQLAIIGAQIGKDLEWKKGGSPIVNFTSLTDKINNSNLIDGKDLFTAIYDYFKQRSMFSGEAIDKARAVIDKIVRNYMAGYSILMECLIAQLMVNALENKEGIDQYYLDNISTNVTEILQTINDISKDVIGIAKNGYVDKTNTVNEKYTRIVNMSRTLFIDKGKCSVQIKTYLDVKNHGNLWSKDEDMAVGSFNSEIWNHGNHLSGEQIKDLASYAKEKGMTIREVLNTNGISTDNAPANTYLATAKAYDDLGIKDFLSGIFGSVHLHGFYKGINIDEKNPSEKEVLMWNHGCNGYLASTWNFAEPGNAATIGY